MTEDEINDLIAEADRDGDGKLNEDDFFRVMHKTGLFAWQFYIVIFENLNKIW